MANVTGNGPSLGRAFATGASVMIGGLAMGAALAVLTIGLKFGEWPDLGRLYPSHERVATISPGPIPMLPRTEAQQRADRLSRVLAAVEQSCLPISDADARQACIHVAVATADALRDAP